MVAEKFHGRSDRYYRYWFVVNDSRAVHIRVVREFEDEHLTVFPLIFMRLLSEHISRVDAAVWAL